MPTAAVPDNAGSITITLGLHREWQSEAIRVVQSPNRALTQRLSAVAKLCPLAVRSLPRRLAFLRGNGGARWTGPVVPPTPCRVRGCGRQVCAD